jgi:hypothetical protein
MKARMRTLLIATLCVVTLAPPAAARAPFRAPPKPPVVLEPGMRVRVTLLARKDAPLTGTLLALSPEAISLEDSIARAIPRMDIAKLEISHGMKSRAGRFAGYGALLFGVASGISAARIAQDLSNEPNDTVVLVTLGSLSGMLVGAGLGAFVGGGMTEERWERVPVK